MSYEQEDIPVQDYETTNNTVEQPQADLGAPASDVAPVSAPVSGYIPPSAYHQAEERISETRLFVRPFPEDVQEAELVDIFQTFGAIKEIKILRGFAFVEFENKDDASRAMTETHGKLFADQPLDITYAKLQPIRYRITLKNLPESCNWQDLKDLARENGLESTFSSVNQRDFQGEGNLEFPTEEVLAEALTKLNNIEFKGNVITVERDDNPPPIRRSRGGFRGGSRGGFRGGSRGGFRGGFRDGGFRGGRGGFREGGFRGGRGGFRDGGFRGGSRGGFREGGFRGGRGGFREGGFRGGRGGYQREGGFRGGYQRERSPSRY